MITFSNRCFPTKAVAIWRSLDMRGHASLIHRYMSLAGFSGIALGDAASVHKSMAKAGDFRMAFCWSHARRKFIKSESSEPIRSKQFIDMVAELYAIEAQAPPVSPPGANGTTSTGITGDQEPTR